MAYIDLPEGLPGIRGPMAFRPETAKPLNELAEVLLRAEHSLTRGERELIGTYVSHLNDCFFCQHAHSGLTQHYLQCDTDAVDGIVHDPEQSDLSPKMKALLAIAAAVQKGGKHVLPEHIERAKKEGASDVEIHDTVLIAAAFCMFNRYVDGLGTWAPTDRMFYVKRAPARAEEGYANYNPYH
jgi:uncharacterized peroxidase-related enzyme